MADPAFTAAVAASPMEQALLGHLGTQIESAQRLLQLILEQGAAIRTRDVEQVLVKLSAVQAEMGRRSALEMERARLLAAAGQQLGVNAADVTLSALCTLVTPEAAQVAVQRSAALRGLLAEIAREHGINRALMRQEMAFVSHLTRLMGGAGEDTGAYTPASAGVSGHGRSAQAPAARRVLDLQA